MEEIAQVYARSLFQVARDQDKLDVLHNTPAKLAPGLADAATQNAKARVKAY